MKRILAYLIDMMIVTMLASCLSTFPIINVNYNEYENKVEKYEDKLEPYIDFIENIEEKYEDKEIDKKEYKELQEDYIEIIDLNEYFEDEKITEKEYDEIYDKVYNEYMKIYQDGNYELMKINYISSIITIICTILYFVVFGYFCNGQTLGKKMLHLQVVSKNNKKASMLKLLLRTIILTGIITNTINLILLFSVNKSTYFTVNEYVIMIAGLIEMTILFMVLFRKDKRGLHDMIAGTKVVDLKENTSQTKVIDAEFVEKIDQKEKLDEEQERLRERFK